MSQWKWALVTGASSGIGWALAEAFAKRGLSLVLVARRKERLTDLASVLEQRYRARVIVVVEDLVADGAVDRVTLRLQSEKISLDVLVNNAGAGVYGPFQNADRKKTLNMLDLNVRAVVDLTMACLPQLIKNRGAILNIGSVAGFQSLPMFATYAATKAFILSWSDALGQEMRAQGVKVTNLCPGPVQTEFFEVAEMSPKGLRGASIQSAEWVAEMAIKGLYRDQARVVTHWTYHIAIFVQRFFPRSWVTFLAGRVSG